MTKWTGRLKHLIDIRTGKPLEPSRNDADDSGENEGQKYLDRVRAKLDKLVEDFAKGRVNRAQFEELYAHYQKERRTIETLMTSRPSSDAWRMAVTEGQSVHIRRRLAARVLGYAVYANRDEAPLRVYGEFASLHQKWVSPLLAKVSQAHNQPFVVSSFDTGGEESPCLCAVAGQVTTLLVLFTNEPARVQMQSLEDLHCHFEQANYRVLSHYTQIKESVKADELIFPYAAAFE